MADSKTAPKAEAKAAAAPAKTAASASSSPPASTGAPAKTAAGPDEKEVCRAFRNNGECRFKEECKYVHTEGEPIPPPPRDYTPRGECHNWRDKKECRFAERCRFLHGEEDKRTTYRPERKKDESGAEATGEKQICRNYQRKGKCRFGEKCHHIHVAPDPKEKKTEAPAKRAPKTEKKAAPKKAPKTESKTAAGAGAGAGAGGEGKKKRRRTRKPKKADPATKMVLTEENKYDADGLELCRNYRNKGKCRFGDDCTFSHAPGGPIGQPAGERPPRGPRVPGLCYNFRDDGNCEFGAECRFKHGDADTRDFSTRGRGGRKPAASS